MTALVTLAVCAVAPWLLCKALGASFRLDESWSFSQRERALIRYRRSALLMGAVALPSSAVAGAIVVHPVFATRWPLVGSFFFAAICWTATWSSLALVGRTRDEAEAMPVVETIGRVVQMSAVLFFAVALSLLASRSVEAFVPMVPAARAVVSALLGVAAVVVVAPWLAVKLGLWRELPFLVDGRRRPWRVAHLPVPAPFLTHAAALPWLRTVLVTDGLLRRAPDAHWRSLLRYEIGGTPERSDIAARWSVSIPLSIVVFLAAGAVGATDARKLVASTFLAVLFTGAASWLANREPPSKLVLDSEGPTMQELAQTLRSLPPCYGQAFPRTSRRPLGTALYDRLFALGHDPGRRPHT